MYAVSMKLTAREQHLLRFPPTQTTWLCRSKRNNSAGVSGECGFVNSGLRDRCSLCAQRAVTPARRKLLWPEYIRAAVKAGLPEESYGLPHRPENLLAEKTKAPVKRRRK